MWSLKQYHGYDIAQMEQMIVFERDIYVDFVMAHLKELENKQRAAEQ